MVVVTNFDWGSAISFPPTPDQEELRRTVRRFFDACSPESVVRETMAGPTGHDTELWKRMATELGLLGLAVPEQYGGAGATAAEACLVLEEAGRALVCAPLLSTLGLAVNVLLLAADDATRDELLPPLVAGALCVAVAMPGPSTTLTGEDALTGECRGVLDAGIADVLLVLKPAGTGHDLIRVELAGLVRRPREALDLTRRHVDVVLDAAPARRVGHASDAELARIRDLAVVALAAEQVGGAQCALDAAVSYAGLRVQFGRTIGSFQAVKHRLADMLVAVETARSAAHHAIDVAVHGDDRELAVAAALAGAYCSEAYAQVAEDALQVHGGIGFTWEHPAHLWFRRAKADVVLFGTPGAHRARLAELIP
jgi:alkylation response protein AidB-like acyl-CoA dehydrogenase